MEYKYKQDNIPSAIARAIFDNKSKQNRNDRMYYREIKSSVEQLLLHPLSDRQLVRNLSTMVDKKLLDRDDPTGRRGSKVYFSLTEKGTREYGLKILGIDEEVQRRKRLYNLIIFFEAYKRSPLITEEQLYQFLNVIVRTLDDFKIREIGMPYHIPGAIHRRSIDGIDVLSIPKYDRRTKVKKAWYYIVVPGFSVEEFIKYHELLKRGEEPRPFNSSPTIIPFVVHTSYTKNEVEEAISLIKESGLIQQIDPVFSGEIRYDIVGEFLKRLVYCIWCVRMLDYHLLTIQLFRSKPIDQFKKYLRIYFGEKGVDMLVAQAHHARKLYKNKNQEQEEVIMQLLCDRRNLVQLITEKYEKIIEENQILRDIVEEICFLPFYLPSNSN